MQTLNLDQLRTAISAGGVENVKLTGEGSGFFIKIHTRAGSDAILAKTRSTTPRRFSNPGQAFNLLFALGLEAGAYDLSGWTPNQKPLEGTRPDSSLALKRAHEAAAHDKWFRESVEAGINDLRPRLSETEAETEILRRRKILQRRLQS